MNDVEHTAVRPTWNCRACGEPWPCVPAKRTMLATLTPTHLAIQGWGYLEDAAMDLYKLKRELHAHEAFQRFVSWTWPENAVELDLPPE